MNNHIKPFIYKIILASLSGTMLTLSFPKPVMNFLIWIAFIPLFISIRNLSPIHAFLVGVLTGLVHYLTLMYWLPHTLYNLIHFPIYLCLAIHFCLSLYLSLYMGLFSLITIKLCIKPIMLLFISPALWVSFEYIRTYLFTGFPWGLLGYSQYNCLNIIQIADMFGVYGVSFLIILCNAALFIIFLYMTGRTWQKYHMSKIQSVISIFYLLLIIGLALLYGKQRILTIESLCAVSPSYRFSIIQGNIDQSIKWDPTFIKTSETKYLKLSIDEKQNKPDMIIWPETALTYYYERDIKRSKTVNNVINALHTYFLIGSPCLSKSEKGVLKDLNAAYLIGPDAKICGRYDKVHLVPFGEYIPYKKWLPFFDKIVEGENDYISGKKIDPIKWGKFYICIQICYEIIFPNPCRKLVKNNSQLIINITNDAWFGKTSGPYQHFSYAIFRAIENRRSLLRAANTGISGFINPVGRIIASTSILKDETMTHPAVLFDYNSIYTRVGDMFALINLVFIFLLILIRQYLGLYIMKKIFGPGNLALVFEKIKHAYWMPIFILALRVSL